MIAVVDYHKGNLKSVERGIAAAGGEAVVTDDAALIGRADAVVLPGVGAFADASATMRALGQMDVIRERIVGGAPFLGICLGLHLMFEEGVEGTPSTEGDGPSRNAPGLALLPGVVMAMPRLDASGRAYKVPHVGWNTVAPAGGASDFGCPLLKGVEPGEYFYFTHSYVAPHGAFAVAETTHSVTFPSVVHYGEVAFGVQFHPEKSSDVGATVLRNFVELTKGA